MNKLLVISGPTATGKTQLAFKLAKLLNGELISADSRQVYKGMDIGTGKEFSAEIPTWECDVVRPDEEWSAAHFVKLANKLIPEIQNRQKLPIVVGGTGLYIVNLLNPPETLNIPPNNEFRQKLERLTLSELQGALRHLNEKRFNQMNDSDQRNPRRLIRAIEVVKFRKLHKSRNGKETPYYPCYNVLHVGLTVPIKEIDRRIEERVRQRLQNRVEQEVRRLVKKYGWDSALSFTIGYQEWKPYFDGECSIDEAVKRWTTHEKQYARRQLVWMAKYSPDKLFDSGESNHYQDIEAHVCRWYYGKE
ncbi:tRNA (adenosine(37)-N6)-dimethylallyltransferase MiaA [Candidatus Collierbacteria bacterium]|nr:tRNA (adenosine(37)-N6)-dimethylallyltransferase MiaA [Candidatus Collierbacteria bacterium]